MSLTTTLQLGAQDVRETSTTKQHALGTKGIGLGGRVYRYAQAGAVALDHGKLTVNAEPDANVVNKTIARTYAAGVTELVVDVAGTVVEDAYADGTFTVSDATGEGYEYRVTGNTGRTGAGEITVSLAEPTKAAVTIDVSEYTLQKNVWDDVQISVTDQLDFPTGVPNVDVAIGAYFWAQTGGPCAILADASTHARGSEITISAATAGAVGIKDAAGEAKVGVETNLLVSTEYREAFLTIDN